MGDFRLHDWNDLRLILACAERGSFAAAAAALGMDQTTVSRRVAHLEQIAGRPLFTRRRSGAEATLAGMALLEQARMVRRMVEDFEQTLTGLDELPPPTVTIGASEGLLAYILIPVLLGDTSVPQPVDASLIRHPLPALAFSTDTQSADIAVVATSTGTLPSLPGAFHVRRIGVMHFMPVAGRSLLESRPRAFSDFDELTEAPLLDVAIYRRIRSLDGWNQVVAENDGEDRVALVGTTRQMHQALVEGKGVGILPTYSRLYDDRIAMLEVAAPKMDVYLWLVAHEDKLREPAIRHLYDTLAQMFLTSPWFRP